MTREVMEQALEALENHEGNYKLGNAGCDRQEAAITAIKEALAQPEQEPVSCRFCHDKKGCWAWQCDSCGEIDDVQQPAPQRPWQGLTEDEKFEMAAMQYGWEDLLIAAEAKLKELNHG